METVRVYYLDGGDETFKSDRKTIYNKNMEWLCFQDTEVNCTVYINPAEVRKVESVFTTKDKVVPKKAKNE
jgi:hypothetical protein